MSKPELYTYEKKEQYETYLSLLHQDKEHLECL